VDVTSNEVPKMLSLTKDMDICVAVGVENRGLKWCTEMDLFDQACLEGGATDVVLQKEMSS
jgi:hypothetical protein